MLFGILVLWFWQIHNKTNTYKRLYFFEMWLYIHAEKETQLYPPTIVNELINSKLAHFSFFTIDKNYMLEYQEREKLMPF